MRVAVTGAGGRLGRALIAALADAPFTGLRRPDRLDAGPTTTSTIPTPRPGSSRAIGRRSSSTPRPGPMSTAAPATRIWRSAGTPRRPASWPGPAPRPGSISSSSRRTRCSTARGPMAGATARRPDRARQRRTGRASSPASWPPVGVRRRGRAAGPHWRSSGPPGCTVRPAHDFPAKIVAAALRARAAGEPLRVVGDEFGSPTSAADVAEAIVELIGSGAIDGTYHYVDLGAVSRADWAREVLRLAGVDVELEEVPASTWVRASTPPRWGVLESSPLAVGRADAAMDRGAGRPRPVPAPADVVAGGRRAGRMAGRDRRRSGPPSGLPGVRYGAVVRHVDRARLVPRALARERLPAPTDPGRAGRLPTARGSSRPTCRPRPPASCAGCTTTGGSSIAGSSRAGRAFVALVDVRPVAAGTGPAVVETRTLAADDWVEIPAGVAHGFLAVEPLELVYLVTAEFDASDELGFAWDDPAVGVPGRCRSAATGDGRPILSERDRTNPPLAELVASLRGDPRSDGPRRRTRPGAIRCAAHHRALPTAPLRSQPHRRAANGPWAPGPSLHRRHRSRAGTLRSYSSRPPVEGHLRSSGALGRRAPSSGEPPVRPIAAAAATQPALRRPASPCRPSLPRHAPNRRS